MLIVWQARTGCRQRGWFILEQCSSGVVCSWYWFPFVTPLPAVSHLTHRTQMAKGQASEWRATLKKKHSNIERRRMRSEKNGRSKTPLHSDIIWDKCVHLHEFTYVIGTLLSHRWLLNYYQIHLKLDAKSFKYYLVHAFTSVSYFVFIKFPCRINLYQF